MGIKLEDERATGSPVVKRGRVGESFVGAIVKYEWRQIVRDDVPQFKDNGKPRNELVVNLLAVEGDMTASIGGTGGVPEPGDTVRAILRGGAAGQWIEAVDAFKAEHKRTVEVGDLIKMTTTHATRYSASPTAKGQPGLGDLNTQDEVEAWQQSPANMNRSESLGYRGDVKIAPATGERAQWVAKAEEAYHALSRQSISAEQNAANVAAVFEDTDPF